MMKNINQKWIKAAVLLTVSMGLFWFSEQFSPATIFEPQSTGWVLWMSYAKDLVQPFAFYCFICLGERWIKKWQVRALLAFVVPALLEFGQVFYHGFSAVHIYVGSFDPADFLVYAVGVSLAVAMEQQVFVKVSHVWQE